MSKYFIYNYEIFKIGPRGGKYVWSYWRKSGWRTVNYRHFERLQKSINWMPCNAGTLATTLSTSEQRRIYYVDMFIRNNNGAIKEILESV